MDAGADPAELDAASASLLQVAAGLAAEQAGLRELLGGLVAAAGLRQARLGCDGAGQALVPALGRLRASAQRLSDDAAAQSYRFALADGRR